MRLQTFAALIALLVVTVQAQPNPISPKTSNCPAGSVPIMIRQGDKAASPGAAVGGAAPTDTLGKCSKLCKDSNECVGFVYEAEQCTWYTDVNPASFAAKPGSEFFQKSCVNSDKVCSSPFTFDMVPQYILIGFAREVVQAATLSECLDACLNTVEQYGFECESVMYYPQDTECILNTEDRRERPDVFTPESIDEVIYLDNNCAGTQCYAPEITQFTKTDKSELENNLDLTVTGVTFTDCSEMCITRISKTGDDFNCKSFMYDAGSQTCVLADERAEPLGRASLIPSGTFDYYEKKCFTSKHVCRNPPAFDRVPQKILVGFAAFVLEKIPSVTQCLDNCVEPPAATGDGFQCKSVMYYYNEQECILNSETRATKPDLFIEEGEGFKVDYFDITCQLRQEECPDGGTYTSVKQVNVKMDQGENRIHVLETIAGTAAQCQSSCYTRAPEKCRSFNFDTGANSCELLYLNTDTAVKFLPMPGTDFYEDHCIAGSKSGNCDKHAAAFDLKLDMKIGGAAKSSIPGPISINSCLYKCINADFMCQAAVYHKKTGRCDLHDMGENMPSPDTDVYMINCVPDPITTTSTTTTTTTEAPIITTPAPITTMTKAPEPPVEVGVMTICNFDGMKVVVNQGEKFTGAVFAKMKYDTCRVEVKDEMSATLMLGFPVETETDKKNGGGGGYQRVRRNAPQPNTGYGPAPAPHPQPNPGYGTNPAPQPQPNPGYGTNPAPQPQPNPGYGSNPAPQPQPNPGYGTNPAPQPQPDPGYGTKPAPQPQPNPGYGTAPTPQPGYGKKPQPKPVRDCGVKDLKNGTYTATIVVQSNNMGIPGLVTAGDKIYTVSCDYSNAIGEKKQAEAKLTANGPKTSEIKPRGKIELNSPVMMMMMNGATETPILQAKLGDVLELRWEMMALEGEMDFFVKECVAERGGSVNPPPTTPAPGGYGGSQQTAATSTNQQLNSLTLIEKGCPTAAVAKTLMPSPVEKISTTLKTAKLQAFRFDGSKSVRIICKLEICDKTCNPTTCDINGNTHESFGRKKREAVSENHVEHDQYLSPEKFETSEYFIPRHSQAMASLVIYDPLQDLTAIEQTAAKYRRQPTAVQPKTSSAVLRAEVDEVAFVQAGRVCLPKSTFIGIFLFLGILTLVQACVVAAYLIMRLSSKRS